MTRVRAVLLLLALSAVGTPAWAQVPAALAAQGGGGCNELFQYAGLVWHGATPTMTLQQLAAYAAPVYWLSPDEPTLHRKLARDIRVPLAFPFQPQVQSPVVYYQFTAVASRPDSTGPPVQVNAADKGASVLNLAAVGSIRMKYIAYFPEEAGVGEHTHVVEPAEFRLFVGRAIVAVARVFGSRASSAKRTAIPGTTTSWMSTAKRRCRSTCWSKRANMRWPPTRTRMATTHRVTT
jgi:hypothetical protein